VLQINGSTLTQSLTVAAVNGVATFNNVGYTSTVTAPQTLTFTADGFVGTSTAIAITYMPNNVTIASGVTTQGYFVEGLFYASTTSGTTNIRASDLVAHLASFSTVISASGFITLTDGFTSATASDLVLRAASYINVAASLQIRTHGGDIVLWADSDNNSAGFVRILSASTLCTTGGTCGTTTTGGGDIIIGGGVADPTNSSRPSGAAAGSSSTYNSTGTSETTGAQIGTMAVTGGGAKLYSAGGNISIQGRMHPSIGSSWQ
jgi:hypothetical protein